MSDLNTSADRTNVYSTDAGELVSFATYRPDDKRYESGMCPPAKAGGSGAEGAWRRHRLTRADVAVTALLIVAALLVRWPFIARGETLLHSDEAIVGLMAQDIAAGERFPIYFYGQRYMGALEAYVIAAVSPLFENPIQALRFGPACFFALLVAVQYLMLTRWFGRRGGLVGATVLLAGAPMFMQWSISARGGYIEILLWGSALMWAYSEWFVAAGTRRLTIDDCRLAVPDSQSPIPNRQSSIPNPRHRFLLGALIGSGLWINPSIVLFVFPIVVHALLNRPLATVLSLPRMGGRLRRVAGVTGVTTLPVVVILAVLLFNATWAVWVDEGHIRNMLLLDVFPTPIAVGLLAAAAIAVALYAVVKTSAVAHARRLLQTNGLLVVGVLAGAAPAALYVLQTTIGMRAMDPSLPLGFRPLWFAGDTLHYLIRGLPLLFGADPRPFLQLVSVGRDTVVMPMDIITSGLAVAANWVVLGAMISSLFVLLFSYRGELSRLLRLQPGNHPAVTLLALGFAGALGLFVMGGCTLDFTTIRYLVPLWAFVPGLLAAVFVGRRFSLAGRLAPLCACAAWAAGQWAMYQQLGNPHPLRRLATALTARHIDPAVAEPLDAHLLSYLTRRRCRTAEFESFWPRLAHYRQAVEEEGSIDYIVQTAEIDRTGDWLGGGWPGEPPPETSRFLWPRLRRALIVNPTLLVAREPLVDGYERIRLRKPLTERRNEGFTTIRQGPLDESGADAKDQRLPASSMKTEIVHR